VLRQPPVSSPLLLRFYIILLYYNILHYYKSLLSQRSTRTPSDDDDAGPARLSKIFMQPERATPIVVLLSFEECPVSGEVLNTTNVNASCVTLVTSVVPGNELGVR
jgi:hypothetical protein